MFYFQSEGGEKMMFQFEGNQAGILSYLGRVCLFVLFKPSADWMRIIYFREGCLIESIHLFLKLTSSKNTLPEMPIIMLF